MRLAGTKVGVAGAKVGVAGGKVSTLCIVDSEKGEVQSTPSDEFKGWTHVVRNTEASKSQANPTSSGIPSFIANTHGGRGEGMDEVVLCLTTHSVTIKWTYPRGKHACLPACVSSLPSPPPPLFFYLFPFLFLSY